MTFDNDQVNSGNISDDGWPEMEPKSQKKSSRWIWLSTFFVVILLAGLLVTKIGYGKLNPSGEQAEPVSVVIPEGSSTKQISELLEESDVIPSSKAFQAYMKLKGDGATFQAGTYQVPTNSAVWEAKDVLLQGPEAQRSPTVGFAEGKWVSELVPLLAEQIPSVTEQELLAVLESDAIQPKYRPEGEASWEGLLFPAQYEFPEDVTAEEVIVRLNDEFNKTVDELGYNDPAKLNGYSPYEVITIASMIESEARFPADRPLIAEVMYHRLSDVEPNNSWLGIDATVIYSAQERGLSSGEIAARNRDADDPYNTSAAPENGAASKTRLRLPPTPVSSPGRASLEAAINPSSEGYSYYVLENAETGEHKFTSSIEEHNKAVANQP